MADKYFGQLKAFITHEDPEASFDLDKPVGSGAFGVVYKAKDRKTNRQLAVKKLQLTEENIEVLKKEVILLGEIKSPACVEYLGSFYKDGHLFITMEYFDGGSIGDILNAKKCLSEQQIGSIIAQTLPAVDYLHASGKIHRDLKAANLLLNSAGVVKLCDFGITTSVEPGKKRETQVGSPFWMAPEIISGEGYDQKADIWALGITAFEMAESEHPFFNLNPMTAMFQIVSDPVPKLSNLTAFSSGFLNFVDVCLDKDPSSRPSIKSVIAHPWVRKFANVQARQELVRLYLEIHAKNNQPRGSSPHLETKHPHPAVDRVTRSGSGSSGGSSSASSSPNRTQVSGMVSGLSASAGGAGGAGGSSQPGMQHSHSTSSLPSNVSRQQQGVVSSIPEQAIVKFSMPDKSIRSLLVKRDDTAKDICAQLRKKVGLDDSESYTLYHVTARGDEEKPVSAEERILLVQKTENVSQFVFKETPDTKSWNTLTQVFNNLRGAAGKAPISILRSPQDLKLLVQVLLGQNLSVVTALAEVTPDEGKDLLVQALVPLFESQNQTPRLMKKIAKREIATCENLSNHLLRNGDSVLCKLMSHYGRLISGSVFIKKCLSTAVTQILSLFECPELDTNRMKATMDLKTKLLQLTMNLSRLQQIARPLVTLIIASLQDLPTPICLICRDLQIISAHYFRFEWKLIVPFSFVFGQILCPALLSPKLFGLCPPDTNISEESKRTLILMSKILHAIGSGKGFEPDDYMSVMNVFIAEFKTQMEHFFEQVLRREAPSADKLKLMRAEIPPVELQKSVLSLYQALEERKVEVGVAMKVLPKSALNAINK